MSIPPPPGLAFQDKVNGFKRFRHALRSCNGGRDRNIMDEIHTYYVVP